MSLGYYSVSLTINNNSGMPMSIVDLHYDHGKVNDFSEWPQQIAHGRTVTIENSEHDWSVLGKSCGSGIVRVFVSCGSYFVSLSLHVCLLVCVCVCTRVCMCMYAVLWLSASLLGHPSVHLLVCRLLPFCHFSNCVLEKPLEWVTRLMKCVHCMADSFRRGFFPGYRIAVCYTNTDFTMLF